MNECPRGCVLGLVFIRISPQAYNDWQENPVLTSVKTTGKPISEMEFPAITICSQGTIDQVKYWENCNKIKFAQHWLNIKVYNNLYKYQLSEYAKSQGMNLESLTTKELEELEDEMIAELYPGLSNPLVVHRELK